MTDKSDKSRTKHVVRARASNRPLQRIRTRIRTNQGYPPLGGAPFVRFVRAGGECLGLSDPVAAIGKQISRRPVMIDERNIALPSRELIANRDGEKCMTVLAHSEDGLADQFAERYEGKLRWCPKSNRWQIFDGQEWQRDRNLEALRLASEICRAVAVGLPAKHQMRILSARTRRAIVDMAKSDQRLQRR